MLFEILRRFDPQNDGSTYLEVVTQSKLCYAWACIT